MTARRKPKPIVTTDLITFHKINAKRLRNAACRNARQMIHTWLAKIMRRRAR